MGQIDGNNKDVVPVVIKKAWYTHADTQNGRKLLCKLTGEDAEGNTGTCTVWMDDELCTQGREKDIGRKNIEIAIDDLVTLGLDRKTPGDLSPLVGSKRAQFYISKKEKAGVMQTNYYLQIGEMEVPADQASAEILAMLGGDTAKDSESADFDPDLF